MNVVKWLTLSGSLALLVAVVVLDRRGRFDTPPPPSHATTVAVAGPPPGTIPLVPPPPPTPALVDASTVTSISTPTSTPTSTLPAAIAPAAQRLTVRTESQLGVALRSDCADEAQSGGGWPEGQSTTLIEAGTADCEGWSLVESSGVQSWVRNEYLQP